MFFTSGCSSIDKAESLYREGDKQAALEMAISLMDKDEPAVRLRAVKLIGKIGEKVLVQPCLSILMIQTVKCSVRSL